MIPAVHRATRLLATAGIVLIALGAGYVLARGLAFERAPLPPAATAAADCLQPAPAVAATDWRFRLDPDDTGLADGWVAPDFDDSHWDVSAPGTVWEDQGYEYDGVAWYRGSFTLPAAWETAFLGIAGVDDTAMLWIDGEHQEWDPADGPGSFIVELPRRGSVTVALRIEDRGGVGGIKQPVLAGAEPRAVVAGGDYARWLAVRHPDWPLPAWTRDEHHAWTVAGSPRTATKALLTADTSVAPWATAPLLGLYVREPDGGLVSPDSSFGLLDGFLPVPEAHWQAAGLDWRDRLSTAPDGDGAFLEVTSSGEAQPAELVVVTLPLTTGRETRQVASAGLDSAGGLWLDGAEFLRPSQRPTRAGFGSLDAAMSALQQGELPAGENLACAPAGDAAAVLVFELAPGSPLRLSLQPAEGVPPQPVDDMPAPAALRAWWQERLPLLRYPMRC